MVKRNIISGLLLLFLSMMLGPLMIFKGEQDLGSGALNLDAALMAVDEAVAAYEQAGEGDEAQTTEGEEAQTTESDKASAAGALAVASAKAQLARRAKDKSHETHEGFVYAHVHGNLEGVLNIVVGLFLGLIAITTLHREVTSWLLIAGSWLHGGLVMLGQYGLALPALNSLLLGGAILLILGVLSVLVGLIWKGFKEA